GRPDARSRETRWESGGRPVVRASPSRERWCVKAGAPPAAGWAAGGPGGAFRSASGDAGSLYLRDEEGECAASLVTGLQVEVVRAGGREDDLPERHDQASLCRRPVRAARLDVRMALDGQELAAGGIHQVGAERDPTGEVPRPFDDEYHGHLLLHGREPGRVELVEYTDEVQLSVGPDAGFVARYSENQFHGAGKMAVKG